MFKNYIISSDLKEYAPLMDTFLWSTQTDYQPQIDLAGKLVEIDLRSKDIDTRLIYVPNDLQVPYSPVNSNNLKITYTDVTDATGPNNYLFNYKRFGVNVTNYSGTGSLTFVLEGSNYRDITNIPTNDWSTITELVITGSGEKTVTFDSNYANCRYTLTVSGSLTGQYAVFTQDTAFDEVIATKALSLIFTDLRMTENDKWDKAKQDYDIIYDKLIGGSKFLLDLNDDGKPDVIDPQENPGTLKFY